MSLTRMQKRILYVLSFLFIISTLIIGIYFYFNPRTTHDVIVFGSEPEAIAAAVSSSRNDMKTLMIDTKPKVGGLMTLGWLNSIDMIYNPEREILNKGLFLEFYNQIEGDSFQIDTAQAVFDKMIKDEPNLDVILEVDQFEPIIRRGKMVGVQLIKDHQTIQYYAKRFIDATQDADFAYKANVPFTLGQEDYTGTYERMAVTLVFELSNVNWDKIYSNLVYDDNINTGANQVSAWGFWEEMLAYKPKDMDVGVRGLNIGRVAKDKVLINAMFVFNVDGLDPESKQNAMEKAKKELTYMVPYMNKTVAGFEKATLSAVAPELYVRETRHMQGLYRLTLDDVLENRDFEDRIAFGSYPVDIQATSPTNPVKIVGNPKQYAIPFRSIVPPNHDNLLVVGRSASFDSLAHGSARVIPVGMATGEAAGVASSFSIKQEKDFQQIAANIKDVNRIQDLLNQQGMVIQSFSYPAEIIEHWAYEGLKFIRSYGLAIGEYQNNYQLDKPMTRGEFIQMVDKLNKRIGEPWETEKLVGESITDNTTVTMEWLNQRLLDTTGVSSSVETADHSALNRGTIYMALYDVYIRTKNTR